MLFILIQKSTVTKFKGYPDFLIRKSAVGSQYIIKAIGEMQSNERDTVLQGGIYSVGEFRKKQEVSNEIVCIALHENKTANVMLARLDRGGVLPNNALGSISYKYVEDTNPLSLTSAEGVMNFANRVILSLPE